MSDPIKVSAKEFERLQALQAMRETGQSAEPGKRDIGAEMWDAGKRVGKWYLIYLAIVTIIGAAILLPLVAGISHRVSGQFERIDSGAERAESQTATAAAMEQAGVPMAPTSVRP